MRPRALTPIFAALALAITAPTPAAAQGHDSPGQSIQVHGHWIIEVYDGDELVERREFENALTSGAPELISDIFSGDASVGSWIILLEPFCHVSDGSVVGCGAGATATSPTDGDYAGALVLEAAHTISSDGSLSDPSLQIQSVRTSLYVCDATTAPGDCTDTTSNTTFTERTLDTAIPVEIGQDVSITVIISFTSG